MDINKTYSKFCCDHVSHSISQT